MIQRIVLVRHGRSAHVWWGAFNHPEFQQWRVAYEAAGIGVGETPPLVIRELAGICGIVVASDAERAKQSAALLAAGKNVIASPLLRELDLPAPELQFLRLPWIGWAILITISWFGRRLLRRASESHGEMERVRRAAAWLAELAQVHGTVVAVTHGTARILIARELAAIGWHRDSGRRTSRHWSAWSVSRAD